MVLLYWNYRTWADFRIVLCRWTGLYGQCGPERNEGTGAGLAFLPGMGCRLPDRYVMEWMVDRIFPGW